MAQTAQHTTETRPRLDDGETFERLGLTFRLDIRPDEGHEPPWDSGDGHGTVSEWTTRDKRAGERVLATDRSSHRYYDYAGAIKLARKDGWDTEPYKTGTPGERAARAVEADFEYLRRWCEDGWTYIGVVVTLMDIDGDATREQESLWGVESDCAEYITEVAYENAEEIAGRVGESGRVCQVVRR